MDILLTGGTGFLGGRLLQRLLELGHKVRVLVRRTSAGKLGQLPPGADIFFGDVTSLSDVERAAEGAVVIFHAAALVEAWWPDQREFERVNVGGVRNVIHVLKNVSSVRRMIYTSSFFALGPTDGYIGNISQKHSGKDFCTLYERSKFLADQEVRRATAEEGMDIVTLYPTVIYGPGPRGNSNLIVKLVIDHLTGRLPGIPGSGKRLNSYVYVEDVVHAHIAAMDRASPGGRYLLVGETASLIDLFKIVAEYTRKSPPSIFLPVWLAKCVGFLMVLWARLTGQLPVITHESARAFLHDWSYSGEEAAELGLQPLRLREGMRMTLTWLREENVVDPTLFNLPPDPWK